MKKISQLFAAALSLAIIQGCGSKQDVCSLVKEEGKYTHIEEVVCSPSEPQYIKDLIASVIVSHSEKHKPADAIGWTENAIKTSNNIVSQHYNAVLLLKDTSIDEKSRAAVENAAKEGIKPAIDEMLKQAKAKDLSNEQNRVEYLAWAMLAVLPGPIIDTSIKDLDSFRILEYLATSIEKDRNFSIEYYLTRDNAALLDEIHSDASDAYLAKAKAKAIELAKYQLDFDNELGDYIEAISQKPERPKVDLSSKGLGGAGTSVSEPGRPAAGETAKTAGSADRALPAGSGLPVVKEKEGEFGPHKYLEWNGQSVYDDEDINLDIANVFDVSDGKVLVLEKHAGCANYCYSYAFLKIAADGSVLSSETFTTSYPMISAVAEGSAVKVTLATPGGRNDQEWTYQNGILRQTRFIDLEIEQTAEKVHIESWDKPVTVKGTLQKSADGSEWILRLNRKSLLTGDCDHLVDEISVSETGAIPLNTAGLFQIAISCPTAGVFGDSLKLLGSQAESSTSTRSAPAESPASAESPALKIVAAARDCLKNQKYDCAKSKAEAALDIDPDNSEAKQIKRKAEDAQQKAFDSDWGAE